MKTNVLITGTYLPSEGYPNVKHRIALILSDTELHVKEIHQDFRNNLSYRSRWSLLVSALVVVGSLSIGTIRAIGAIVKNRQFDTLYLPYPAIHILWLLSFLPRTLQPVNIVADIFISIYDTAVNDRQLLPLDSIAARALYLFERRAFAHASTLITDTTENSQFYSSLFQIEDVRFRDIPLSIRHHEVKESEPSYYPARSERLKFLFVGTLVPLHGIELICSAFELLSEDLPIELLVVGDGQQAPVLADFSRRIDGRNSGKYFSWTRQWQDAESIEMMIKTSDVCLGIFGSTDKSQRVWPFKNYHYLACGRPLITAKTTVSMRLLDGSVGLPYHVVSTESPEPLAKLITELVNSPQCLIEMRKDARRFYDSRFSPNIIQHLLRSTLCPG